ncbi:YeeE/YedE family protein [Rhizobium alvei]|uniref:YeeE/YedE thiosulfate transporter family protein n=1 Tax=Rhizobium alvei TaxID=1132659 RepID=A0ABT8YFN8_9HYPH|nr:YeeE/YedE thiosulfate transporter family protein [Rhizobium alvei]MDO6962509.1 YeeE/YedE thiosulfate transporter family protein [Rhizobium alvei]
MTEFTPFLSLAGGALIGLAATLLMAFHGRIAGMTGILAGALPPFAADWGWRVAFLAGAILSPLVYQSLTHAIAISVPLTPTALIIGGLIVGVGVTLGSGCTSGHGVCGIARLSPRSAIATLTFMATAIITVFVIRHVI